MSDTSDDMEHDSFMVPEEKCGKDNSVLVNQDQEPNFRGTCGKSKGKLFLVRCFACGGERGKENYAPSVASGQCAWCGWKDKEEHEQTKAESK